MNMMKKELKKREELESTVKVLQSSVAVFQKQIKELRRDQEELQQYDRRLLVRVDGIPLEEKETSEDVLTKVKSLITEAKCEIPDAVIDRAHRIGKVYKDKNSKELCKSVIVRFTTFRHRTKFYYARNSLKNVKVKLDLTKERYGIYKEALDLVENHSKVSYAMVDINCRLKVVLKNGKGIFFTDIESLKNILEEISIPQ